MEEEEEHVHQPSRRARKEDTAGADQPTKSRRKRNPSLKVREQQEADKVYEELRKKTKTFNENGDVDDPSILEHIHPKHLANSHDPSMLKNTLVYRLSHDVPTRAAVHHLEEMPESSFVAQYRDQIPGPDRRTTAMSTWRETATGQAAAAAAAAARRGAARGGRGRARGRGARGRETGRRGRGRARGAPYWLWGEGEETASQEEYHNVEVNTSQTAPGYGSDDDDN